MKLLITTCIVFLCISSQAQYTYAHLDIKFSYSEAELSNYTYENLRLYPIKAKQSFTDTFKRVGKYLSLKDAIEKKKVIISEQVGSAEVNKLTIQNISDDTVMIMSGEVITGGKQNRIIGKDLILLPKSKKIDLSVYCVEAGRWENESTGTNQFRSYYNVGSMGLRKVVDKEANQGKVWSKVEEVNTKNRTSSKTKTYTAINQSAEFNKKRKTYTEFFKRKILAEPNVIGVVVVSGDKVLGCDMFATTTLFRNNFENLLASYATEAIVNGAKVKASAAVVKAYMDKILTNEATQVKTIREKGKVFTSNDKKLQVSSYE